jgi:hypothetical protein
MRDGKTYYQGEEFFLKTCNYLLSMHLNGYNELVVSPHGNYGWEVFLNQEIASRYLHAHFKLIKEMGFNSIRIMNAGIRPRYDRDELAFVINCDSDSNPDAVPKEAEEGIRDYERYVNLDEGGLDYLKQSMDIVLEIAAIYDLKIMWVMGGEARYFDDGQKYRSILQEFGHTLNSDYKNALIDICNTFKYNTTLFSYDIFHELNSFANEGGNINHLSVANSVKDVNNAVKAHDPNHYTTVGLFNIDSFFKLGVKPFCYVDFYNFHVYETVPESDYNSLPEKGMSVNRYLHYFRNTIDEPWMIGENGIETDTEYEHENIEGTYSVSESDQRTTALNILNYSANCGAFGYAYWQFANELIWQNVGLMKYNIGGHLAVEIQTNPTQIVNCKLDYKQIVNGEQNIFKMYNVPESGSCYFNPYRYYDLLQTIPSNSNQTWNGIIEDNYENRIANAVVKIRVDGRDFYTFSKQDGTFTLTTPTPKFTEDGPNPAIISASENEYTTVTRYNCTEELNHVLQLNYISFPAIQTTDNNISVNSGETKLLDQPTMITGNIFVYNGGVLKISNTICFGDNSQLKIYPGGKVILEDGAVLTAIHEYWMGIVMSNFDDLTQIPDSYLSSSGNTIITKAFQGISSHYDNTIDLNGTKFINNYQDVMINLNHAEKVQFLNCDFILTDDGLPRYFITGEAQNHVRLYWSYKVKFVNCNFEDGRTGDIYLDNNNGILAYNVSRLEVLPDPMMGANRSTFKNLKYGIKAIANGGGEIIVDNCEFETVRGIYLYNYDGFLQKKITNNQFKVKQYLFNITTEKSAEVGGGGVTEEIDENDYRPYAIYIDRPSNGYQIEGNVITNFDGRVDNKFGIITNNNGQISNQIYRNSFNELENGVQTIGLNRNVTHDNYNGLQILCNNFNNLTSDIFVTAGYDIPNYGIAMNQGSTNTPAGNLFTTSESLVNFKNDMAHINYFVRKYDDPNFDVREVPGVIDGDISVVPLYEYAVNGCINFTTSLPHNIDIIAALTDLEDSEMLENSINSMLEDIVDGGNTGQTIAAVLHADDNSAWLTYWELMNKSPYLSDTVLKGVSGKEQGLTAPMIRDILVANPQVAKNKDIKQLLKDRYNLLPDYMIAQIESGESIISSKENLEIQKAEQRTIYDKSLADLVCYYHSISDSVSYAEDSIVSLLSRRKESKYMFVLADYFFSKSDISSVKNTLKNMIQICELTDQEKAEIVDLQAFCLLYEKILINPKFEITKLDQTTIELLKMFEVNGGVAGIKATALLMANNATDYRESIFKPELQDLRDISIKKPNQSQNPSFSVYPNPASEYIYVEYKIEEENGTVQIVISDISGKILYRQVLNNLQDIVIIKTEDFPEGSYNCSLYCANKLMFNNKIVLKK